jgi:hypothetical protein
LLPIAAGQRLRSTSGTPHAERHAADVDPDPVVTADEWLAAHRDSDTAEDLHRPVTDADVIEHGDDRAEVDDAGGGRGAEPPSGRSDRDADDQRDHLCRPTSPTSARSPPAPRAEDVVRVPTAAQTAADVVQAERALIEIRTRKVDDQLHAEQERAAELTRWHHDDQAERGAVDDTEVAVDGASGDSVEPVLER